MTLHRLTKKEIKRFALEKRSSGQLYDRQDFLLDDNFLGSIDRFCDIAEAFRGCRKILDIGAGSGLLLALLKLLGHDVYAVDFVDHSRDSIYQKHDIPSLICNAEVDPLPFLTDSLDAVSCCQALEHFTYSHLPAVIEMRRVLKPGGLLEIDVPNAVSFRNRSRMIRGKHITYEYEKHYLDAHPIFHKGLPYFPDRHNREFTAQELKLLLRRAGFAKIEVKYLKSRRFRPGLRGLMSIGTILRDIAPSLRKSLIAFAEKEMPLSG